MTKRHTIEEAPIIEHDDLRELMEADDPSPCISIYVDTSPQTDEKDGNRIRYKDQVKTAGEALRARGAEKRLTDGLLARLEEVGTTETFWLHQQYGLAVFLSRERLLVRRLMGRPGNHAVVADTFNLRPAHQLLRGAMRHQLLCLSVGRVALYESDGRTVGDRLKGFVRFDFLRWKLLPHPILHRRNLGCSTHQQHRINVFGRYPLASGLLQHLGQARL